MADKNGEVRIPFAPSTIETIDSAVLSFVKDQNLFTSTNEGFKKVPIVWASPERAFQSKMGPEIRDEQGALIFPIISVERTSIAKDPNKKGTVWANIPQERDEKGGAIPVARIINQVKSGEFAGADAKRNFGQINYPTRNKKVVFRTYSIPIPVYIEVSYKITIRTEYQEQMNDLVTPFITRPGGINYMLLKKENHRYEAFIQQGFNQRNNSSDYSNDEKRYETDITLKVLGYLIGDGKNQEKPFFAIRENAVEVKIPRERVMFSEIPEHEFGAYYGLAGLPSVQDPGQDPMFPFFTNVPAAGPGLALSSGGTSVTTDTLSKDLDNALVFENLTTDIQVQGQTVFTTSKNMFENSELIFVNGQLQASGADNDYVITDSRTVTFADPGLDLGDILYIRYLVG